MTVQISETSLVHIIVLLAVVVILSVAMITNNLNQEVVLSVLVFLLGLIGYHASDISHVEEQKQQQKQ